MQAEVLHLQTKFSPSPEGLKLGRSRLTHAAVIPATASSQAGTMGTLSSSATRREVSSTVCYSCLQSCLF